MDNTLLVWDPAGSGSGKVGSNPGSVFRIDDQNALIVGNLHGKYRENTHRQHNFSVTNAGIGGQAVSVGLATTYTGLYLWNPAGSGVVGSLQMVSTSLYVAEVAISDIHIGRIVPGGMTTETSAITPTCCSIGSATGAIIHAGYAATILAPLLLWPLVGGVLATAFPYKSGPEQIDGMFEINPNSGLCIIAVTAVTGWFGFAWSELPY